MHSGAAGATLEVMGEWLKRFSGRKPSVSQALNFLWRENNVYFMDNHRAAAWCWFQHMPEQARVRLLHVDQHYDTCDYVPVEIASAQESLLRGSLDQYLGALLPGHEHHEIALVTWDNYIPIAVRSVPGAFESLHFFTSRVGDSPGRLNVQWTDSGVEDLPLPLDHLPEGGPFVVNIDLDAAFVVAEDDAGAPSIRILDDELIRRLGVWTRQALSSGRACVATVALSPECCDGWPQAEHLASLIAAGLELDFRLP